MRARRLSAPPFDGLTPGRLVHFTFDGRSYEGYEGEPLAASLAVAGHPILSRSFRFHRPRGMMCSTGQCGWCECEVDGRPSVRSCRVPVREGLVARGEHALPSVERDLLGTLDLLSRWIPPTFYHHRFLRPRVLRKRYLDVLRAFGGRGRLTFGDRLPVRLKKRRERATDVLVVGGGLAGLLAALGAAEAGASVVLLEAEDELGGHARWRPRTLSLADVLADLVRKHGASVELWTGTSAVGWYDGIVAAADRQTLWEIRARSVVVATGSYERVPSVPGSDRPGVLAARAVEWLVGRHAIVPGERALLVGEGEELAPTRASLERGGVICLGPVPTGTLRRIDGRSGVTAAVVRDGGSDRREKVDLVVFADRTPNLDLVLAAGGALEFRDGVLVPTTNADGGTSVPSLFVVGSATGRTERGETYTRQARRTGWAAAGASARPRAGTGAQPGSGAAVDLADQPWEAARLVGILPQPAGSQHHALVCYC